MQHFSFFVRRLKPCSDESERTEELLEVVTCSILQGGAVGPVSDWQGVDLREGGTRRKAVLLDRAGASGALLPICIVKLLVEVRKNQNTDTIKNKKQPALSSLTIWWDLAATFKGRR